MSCEPPRRVRIVRCPECGSTSAGEDRSQSYGDMAFMLCNECDHGAYANTWDVTFEWNVVIELAPGQPLPEHIRLPDDESGSKP